MNLLETRTTNFGDLIGNGKIYRVPSFQRDYAWQEIEEFVYRLGNLTPLEPHLNRHLGNAPYTLKREIYPQSVYTLTQTILAEEWTPDSLHTRQKHLAQRAIQIWKSDF